MKLSYVRFVSAFALLAALAVAGRAQEPDQLRVTVPHDFVVSGKTLPAGTYRIDRLSNNDLSGLSIRGIENRQGVLLFSSAISSTNEVNPSLHFERVGDQYFLTQIETENHIFSIAVPANAGALVAKGSQSTPVTGSVTDSN